MPPLNLVFMGTAELACDSLRALQAQPGLRVRAVVTQPDRPAGRSLKRLAPPVKETALELQLPVLQPARARSPEFVGEFAAFQPDLVVVVAYGQILPKTLLDIPRHGCLNVHTSLLPRYRGAAPIQFAMLNGDATTGVTIMRMDAGMDTGDILAQTSTPIAADETAQTLHDRLAVLGARLLVETIPRWIRREIPPQPQDHASATYTRKITKEDGRVDWHQPAPAIDRQLRALSPWPGGFTTLAGDGPETLLKIWDAGVLEESGGPAGTVLAADNNGIVIACGSGALNAKVVQLEGRRRLPAAQFLAGHPLPPGTAFTSAPPHNFEPRKSLS